MDLQVSKDTPDTCLHSQQVKNLRLDVPPADLASLSRDIFADSRKPSREATQARPRRLNFSDATEPADSPSSFLLDLDDFDLELLQDSQSSAKYNHVVDQIQAMIHKVVLH